MPETFAALVGRSLGTGEWLTIDQPMIDAFAAVTGDGQWIHVDPARAAAEMPGGRTIAHGYLLLSLVPELAPEVAMPAGIARRINYGLNRVRFLSPVPAGARVRLTQTLQAAESARGGTLVTLLSTMEIEGGERPALSAETLVLMVAG